MAGGRVVRSEWSSPRRAAFRTWRRRGGAVHKSEGFDAGGFGGSVLMLQATLKDLNGQFSHSAIHTAQAISGGLFGGSLVAAEQGLGENGEAILLLPRQVHRGHSCD